MGGRGGSLDLGKGGRVMEKGRSELEPWMGAEAGMMTVELAGSLPRSVEMKRACDSSSIATFIVISETRGSDDPERMFLTAMHWV